LQEQIQFIAIKNIAASQSKMISGRQAECPAYRCICSPFDWALLVLDLIWPAGYGAES